MRQAGESRHSPVGRASEPRAFGLQGDKMPNVDEAVEYRKDFIRLLRTVGLDARDALQRIEQAIRADERAKTIAWAAEQVRAAGFEAYARDPSGSGALISVEAFIRSLANASNEKERQLQSVDRARTRRR